MKKHLFILCSFLFTSLFLNAQTNTFPTSGNVGVGTTNPKAGLHLWDNVANTNAGGDDKSIIRLTNSYSTAFHSGGELQFGLNNISGAEVLSTIKGTYSAWNSGNLGGSLAFYTRHSDGLGLKSRMYINSLGNVGIGTTSPTGQLHISGISADKIKLTRGTGNAKIGMSNNIDNIFLDAGNNGADLFINSNGNVGVGTTSPTEKLHVYGKSLIESNHNGTSITLDGYHGIETSGNSHWLHLNRFSNDHVSIGYNSTSNVYLVNGGGNVGIGTTDTKGFKLGVQGKIAAEEVKVATYANWSDFVFNKDYNLPTLKDVEAHIKEKGHLKDIPNAETVKKDGFYLAEMNAKLLQKIEELTLYTIGQEKEIDFQDSKIESQNNRIEKLEKENQVLKFLLERVKKLEEKIKS